MTKTRNRSKRFISYLAILTGLAACQTSPKTDIFNPHPDILFHKLATQHQKLISRLNAKADISYEDAAFQLNQHHRKEAQRVLSCAREQSGFDQRTIYQIPPRYEIHYYFKGDASAKLAKCTHDPLFIAHSVKYGIDDIKATFEKAKNILANHSIPHSSEYTLASHTLFIAKPYPDTLLSEDAYVKITVEKQSLELAIKALQPIMSKHDFLFVVEGFAFDEVITETTN